MKNILDVFIGLIALILVAIFALILIGLMFALVYYIGYGIGMVVEFLINKHTIFGQPLKDMFGYFFMLLGGIYGACNGENASIKLNLKG